MAPNFCDLHLVILRTLFERGIKLASNNHLVRCAIEMVACTLSSRVQGLLPYYRACDWGLFEFQIRYRRNDHHRDLLPGSV